MTTPRPGRPRDARVHAAILAAVRDLLAEAGYERMTIEGIAARAGVGKQTVYRWWPNRSALVAEAALAGYLDDGQAPPPATDDVATDLRAWVQHAFSRLTDPAVVASVRGLAVAAAARDADATRLYAALTEPARSDLAARLEAGRRRGQVAAGADVTMVSDLLLGAVLYRVLARQPVPTGAELDRMVETVLHGIATR